MTSALSTGRKALSALAVAAVIGVALSPTGAFAKGKHHGHGYGAAAFAGGLVLGALISGAASADDHDEPRCWTENRVRTDDYGDRYVQKARVCD